MKNELGFNNYFDGKKYFPGYAEEILNTGFKSIIIWWGDYENLSKENKYLVLTEAQSVGLHIDSLHAPFSMANTLWKKNCSLHECEAFNTYSECISDAGRFKIPYVVIHPTRAHHVPTVFDTDAALYRIQKLLDIANQNNVILAFENLMNMSFLDLIFNHISHPRLKICYDSGHAFCIGKEREIILKYADLIATTHLHDNNGASDQHLQPGDGMLPWNSIISTLSDIGYNGTFNIECYKRSYTCDYQNSEFVSDAYRKICKLLNDVKVN